MKCMVHAVEHPQGFPGLAACMAPRHTKTARPAATLCQEGVHPSVRPQTDNTSLQHCQHPCNCIWSLQHMGLILLCEGTRGRRKPCTQQKTLRAQCVLPLPPLAAAAVAVCWGLHSLAQMAVLQNPVPECRTVGHSAHESQTLQPVYSQPLAAVTVRGTAPDTLCLTASSTCCRCR